MFIGLCPFVVACLREYRVLIDTVGPSRISSAAENARKTRYLPRHKTIFYIDDTIFCFFSDKPHQFQNTNYKFILKLFKLILATLLSDSNSC